MNNFRRTSSTNRRRSLGQGMTEYLIIVALIAVAAIGTFAFFGKTIREQVGGLAQEVSGQANTGINAATTSANQSSTDSQQGKGLSDFNKANNGAE